MPEISHRCPSCGASTRDFGKGVLFCHECGTPITSSEKIESGPGDAGVNESNSAAAVSSPTIDDGPAETESSVKVAKPPADTHERATARERTRETLQRASQRTRGAIEGNVKRVEKIHQVSTVVLEEATYDPSLRFVLVALGLFVLFIVLLILSKVMG